MAFQNIYVSSRCGMLMVDRSLEHTIGALSGDKCDLGYGIPSAAPLSAPSAVSALYKGIGTISRASKKAAAEFWNYLQDFADLNQQPPTTWTGVAPDHPFLGVAAGSVRLNLPPGLNLPDNVL